MRCLLLLVPFASCGASTPGSPLTVLNRFRGGSDVPAPTPRSPSSRHATRSSANADPAGSSTPFSKNPIVRQLSTRTPTHPETLAAMGSLAVTLQAQGKYAEAEAVQREVLAARREIFGDFSDHPLTLAAMSSLSVTLQAQGLYDEAENLQREVLTARTETLGESHPLTLASASSLAVTLQALGKYDEAEAIQREVLRANAERHA